MDNGGGWAGPGWGDDQAASIAAAAAAYAAARQSQQQQRAPPPYPPFFDANSMHLYGSGYPAPYLQNDFSGVGSAAPAYSARDAQGGEALYHGGGAGATHFDGSAPSYGNAPHEALAGPYAAPPTFGSMPHDPYMSTPASFVSVPAAYSGTEAYHVEHTEHGTHLGAPEPAAPSAPPPLPPDDPNEGDSPAGSLPPQQKRLPAWLRDALAEKKQAEVRKRSATGTSIAAAGAPALAQRASYSGYALLDEASPPPSPPHSADGPPSDPVSSRTNQTNISDMQHRTRTSTDAIGVERDQGDGDEEEDDEVEDSLVANPTATASAAARAAEVERRRLAQYEAEKERERQRDAARRAKLAALARARSAPDPAGHEKRTAKRVRWSAAEDTARPLTAAETTAVRHTLTEIMLEKTNQMLRSIAEEMLVGASKAPAASGGLVAYGSDSGDSD